MKKHKVTNPHRRPFEHAVGDQVFIVPAGASEHEGLPHAFVRAMKDEGIAVEELPEEAPKHAAKP